MAAFDWLDACRACTQKKGGKPLADGSRISPRVSPVVEIDLENMKTTNLRVLAAAGHGQAPVAESSMLKIRGTEIRQEITSLTRRALGPYAQPFVSEALDEGFNGEPIGPRLRRAGRCRIFQQSQTLDLRRLQRGSARDHHQGDPGALIDGFHASRKTGRCWPTTLGPLSRSSAIRSTRVTRSADRTKGWSAEHWAALAELGIPAALFDEAAGGFGGTGFDVGAVFEQLGRALVVEPFPRAGDGGPGTGEGRRARRADRRRWSRERRCSPSRTRSRRAATTSPASRPRAEKRSADGWTLTGTKSVVPQARGGDAYPRLGAYRRHGQATRRGSRCSSSSRAPPGVTIRGYPMIDGGRMAASWRWNSAPATLIAENGLRAGRGGGRCRHRRASPGRRSA